MISEMDSAKQRIFLKSHTRSEIYAHKKKPGYTGPLFFMHIFVM